MAKATTARAWTDALLVRRLTADPLGLAAIILVVGLLAVFVLFPVVRVLAQPGPAEWMRLLTNPRWLRLSGNTLLIATLSTVSAVALGFLFAYATSRPDVPLRRFFKLVAILPLVSPPFMGGLAFILLFGRRGLVTYSLLGLRSDIYGWHGLWMVQTLAFFPIAYLTLAGVLRRINPTLEYAAQDLGAHGFRLFRTVTLPLATPGLVSAALLVGIYTLSDFGNPMLVGGAFKVLATETYTQVTGWGDLGMASALSAALLLPSLVLFALQRYWLEGRSYTTVTGKGSFADPLPTPGPVRWALFAGCGLVAVVLLATYAVVFVGAFAKTWGVNWRPTLENFDYTVFRGRQLWNSIRFAGIAALAGSVFAVVAAFLIHRKRFPGRVVADFAAVLPAALPGTLIGVGYILAFNTPPLTLTGTGTIIVAAMLFRTIPVGYRAAVAGLSQIAPSIEEGAADLGARPLRTLWDVTLPLIRSAFTSALVFTFIRSMNTLSAVIFLVSPGNVVASASILALAEHGDWGQASAMAASLMSAVFLVLLLFRLLTGGRMRLFEL
ncbi:MAG: iron ABC transporter permease [candidate division NC10 bacterium]|nr:iron ABC transporter permease [candidate division NC10 bacterium]